LDISHDKEHRFELALQLNRLDVATELAREADIETKWKTIGDKALADWNVVLAEECFVHARDLGGLLLIYTSVGDSAKVEELAAKAGKLGGQRRL
jgi:coatomer subunit beta'